MSYEDKIGVIADRIIFDCKSANVDLNLVIEEINRISNSEEDRVSTLKKDDELELQEFFDEIEMPTKEEMEQQGFEELAEMQKCREAINYVCYEENCPNRIKDKLFAGFVDCDSYEELCDDSNVNLMTDLDDIASSVLSDIYGGTY